MRKSNGSPTAPRNASEGTASARKAIAQEQSGTKPPSVGFPIVGLGASAGGLAALEEFLECVRPESGFAYIVVMHLSPGRVTLVPEILSKHSRIAVTVATDRQRVEANTVYVAPPGCCVAVHEGQLRLTPPGRELPIDHLFCSLAADVGENAIGVVLSGTGTDGTRGIAAIKTALGLVITQDPESAQYRGMPASAIATHLVDHILAPADMPEHLVRYIRAKRAQQELELLEEDSNINALLRKLLSALRIRTGHDFSAYKRTTLFRRIGRRMSVHGFATLKEYVRFLETKPHEADALFKELLISVTSFFRDPEAFVVLEHELDKLIAKKPDDSLLRAWIAGCATGEEAYSVAIVLKEILQRRGKQLRIQLFATDLDAHAIERARAGLYSDGITADVSSERLERFFTKEDGGYRIRKEVRELLVFATHNIVKDPPFTKLELLTCRNLLIYLEPELQKRVLSVFGYSLNPGGLLMLGTSETIGEFDDTFETIHKKWKVFQMKDAAMPQAIPAFPAELSAVLHERVGRANDGGEREKGGKSLLAERALLAHLVPTSLLVNDRGELVYIHGRTGPYLEPAPGEPNHNVFNMAREGLRLELPAAVRQAGSTPGPIIRKGLQVKTNGGFESVTMIVRRLVEPEALRGLFIVSFEIEPKADPLPKAKRDRGRHPDRVAVLEEELQRTRENLQGTIEELETSNEELKSTNEELQSTNEELQSANEELETSREEMQSLNEELQTVNAELEERNRALSQANDDMQNLLNSLDVATIFLDQKLAIKRFTTQAKNVFNLIDTDVGRPIGDLSANILYENLLDDARDVLRTLSFREREIQTKDGAWLLMRIMPYRTGENIIDGLVITFVDIDQLKHMQQSAKDDRDSVDKILNAIPEAVLLSDLGFTVTHANDAFCETFKTTSKAIIGTSLQELGEQWGVRDLRERLMGLADDSKDTCTFAIDLRSTRFGSRRLAINAKKIHMTGKPVVVLTIADLSVQAKQRAAEGLIENEA